MNTPEESGPAGLVTAGAVAGLVQVRQMLAARGVQPVDTSDDTPEAVAREIAARRALVARRLWERTLEEWPDEDFRSADMASLDADQQKQALRRWVARPDNRLLLLTGDVGRGKSYAAFAVGNLYAAQGAVVRAVKHPRYLVGVQPSGGDPELLRHRCHQAAVLLLDEFGALPVERGSGVATPFAQTETYDLLSMRLRSGLRTVITTNLTRAQLTQIFDLRIISRLSKSATVLEMTGPDRRQSGAGW